MMGVGPNPAPSSPGPVSGVGEDTSTTVTHAAIDIGGVVAKYHKMMEFLYPLQLIGKAVLYIIRYSYNPFVWAYSL